MVRLVHRQSCCVPVTVESWSMSFMVMFEVVQPSGGNSLSWLRHLGKSKGYWTSNAKTIREHCWDVDVMLSQRCWKLTWRASQWQRLQGHADIWVSVKSGFWHFSLPRRKPDNYRTLPTKLKSWSILGFLKHFSQLAVYNPLCADHLSSSVTGHRGLRTCSQSCCCSRGWAPSCWAWSYRHSFTCAQHESATAACGDTPVSYRFFGFARRWPPVGCRGFSSVGDLWTYTCSFTLALHFIHSNLL